MDTLELARALVNALEDKKGENIVLMDIRERASFADYFIICSGTSERMLNALADTVLQAAKQTFGINGKQEGQTRDGWLLIDVSDVVVHLFSPDRRNYYRLEELWSEGSKVLLRVQ